MGSRNNPGSYDCYDAAEPNEPMFILLGRDRDAAIVVKLWAMLRLQQIDLGLRPETDRTQVAEALRCATEMEIWHREKETVAKVSALEFDDRGVPRTGQHARRATNTTSGALD